MAPDETDAAFGKGFKRRFGLSPGAYRASAGEPPPIELAAIRWRRAEDRPASVGRSTP
ncbi:MAG TPA: hypothetical protein VE693_11340 [Gaiellaceae bacterium]|nr:hypothetical protein [Gaiellaceae bacterium]